MEQTITAPSPGESITEVILNWTKKDGDFIKKNEVVAEFESEKASLEVVAEQDGILKISVEDGKECLVGQEVGKIMEGEKASSANNEASNKTSNETSNETSNKTSNEASNATSTEEENAKQPETSKTNTTEGANKEEMVKAEKPSPPKMGKKLEVIIPSSGESITEVEVGSWFKKDGEFVVKDEELVEIESEKANLIIGADMAGILSIKIEQGKTARVGDIVAVIVETSELPAVSPDVADVPSTGEIIEPKISKEETPKEASLKEKTPAEKTSESVAEPAISKTTQSFASPAAAKMMKEENIILEKGSGKGDRITKADVLEAKQEPTSLEKENKNAFPPAFSKGTEETILAHENLSERKLEVDLSQTYRADRKIENRKISFIRKKIAEKLLFVKQNTAMLTTFNELNMGAIQKVRAEYKNSFQKVYNIKLGFLSFFVKASCLALKELPEVNSQLDLEKAEQSIPNYVDMGIAVSSPKGLMVPVIKDADKMGLAQIELEISRLARKAREGKLKVEEMTGGTFTITNGGVFGSMLSTPILNPPQSAILGMHNIVQRAVVIDGKIEIADIMYLALSYDHRVIDGKEAVSFLVRTRDYLENPVRMLLEL